ncbi:MULTISPECIES: hypothetical protein [unclassified Serratia (in: enterobacteria)]|uniref:hypothetical protein n=1 Tax=unclassified Serratia (in: enterobacteria) TaxID=2647522 RepID=UPI002ED0CA14|nr:hypothetical protein [Serratia sp. C2(2)]MEE4445932.1 hypothetical protein [Serratia sp. C2(1)]
MNKSALTLTLSLFFMAKMAISSQDCGSLKKDINTGNMGFYQELVQKSLTQKIKLNTIEVSQVLAESEWLAISAATDISDPGVLFFKNNKFIDVWGGDVSPEEKNNVLKWTRDIHVPDKLAQCFFDSIVIR